MSNFAEALSEEVQRLRKALEKIRDVPGMDVQRLKAIAREALENK